MTAWTEPAGDTLPPDDVPLTLSEQQRAAAQRTVATYAARHDLGVGVAAELMMMLGLLPNQIEDYGDTFRPDWCQ